MRDFTHELDERLQQLVERPPPVGEPHRRDGAPATPPPRPQVSGPPPVRRPGPRPRRRHLFLGGVGTTAAVAASTVLISGTSAAGLPVLETPTSDAGELAHAEALRGTAVDLGAAHVVKTSGGTAAVLTTPDGRRLCLAIPDPNATADDSLGGCRPTAEVERSGLLVQAQGVASTAAPKPRGAFAYVLPVDATGVQLRDGTSVRTPPTGAGVVVASLHGAATLRYSLHGQRRSVALPGPFAESQAVCDGQAVATAQTAGSPRRLASGQGCKVVPAPGH